MFSQSKGALCLKIGAWAAVFAGTALATWGVDVQQNTVGIFVAELIAAAAFLGMFFVWASDSKGE